MQVISLSEELGVGQPALAGLFADTAPQMAQLLAERGLGWTLRNDFGQVIDPWSPSGFSGVIEPRY
jgi:hypothetical protein